MNIAKGRGIGIPMPRPFAIFIIVYLTNKNNLQEKATIDYSNF